MLRAVVVLSLLYASYVEVLNAQNLDADMGAGEGRRLAAVESAYTELMRAEGSDNAVNYENSKVRDQSLFSSTWPRKGGDIYNSGNCKTCRPITADPLTGKQYFLRWKIPASAIQSGIRSIVLGLDQYQVSLFTQSNTNTQDAYQPSVPQQLNTAPQGNNALYVITNSGIVFKINRITGAVIWQFDSGGTVGVGGAAAVLSNQNNNIDPSWVGRGALAVGNSNGLTLLGTQGLRYDWLNFTSSFQGLGDSQVTCSGVAGGSKQDQSVILGTQPKPGATTHFLVQLSDNGKQKSGLANTATPFSSNSYNYFGWKFTVSGTNGGAGFSTTPTIGPDGMVYVGSDKMYALTGAGSLVWSFNDGGDALFSIVNTAAMYSEGRLLFGSLNKKFYCLDGKGGAKKWAYTAGGAWKSYAAASSSSVYAANLDGYLYSLASSTGSLQWKTKLTGATMTAPVSMAADTILYFSNMAISASSGTVLWTLSELEPTAGNLTYAATAVSKDGTVYMGTESGALYALGGAPVPDPDTKFMEDLSNAVLASFKDWSYTSSGNVISTLPSAVNFFNSLDFSKMPDGVTYRKNICPHAADYNTFGEYELYNSNPNSYWYSNECSRQITVTCLNGKITLLRLKYLHRSMECNTNQGSFGSNFYLRGLSVPSSIGGLSGLTQLDLWGTDLLNLPTELGDLPRLRQLQLGSSSSSDAGDFWYNTNSQPSDNIVWSIPTEIGKLTTLWQLSIGSPVELPTHIGQLAGLAELRIDRVGKTISGIPSELGNLMSLTKLTVTTSSNSWALSFNPLIRNKCLPASLVSRLSPSLTQGRGLGLLTTGDSTQGFSPFLPPACLTVPYPSPPPSAAPSSAGSAAPTATEAPTPRMRTYAGTGLFVSKHVDQECKFQAYGVQYPFVSSAGTALKLSTCLPSPPSSNGGDGTTYYTLSCKVGAKKYSIEESVFSSSSCSGAPLSKSVYKHDKVCRWDPTNGGFLKIHCGDDDFLPHSSKKVVLGRPSASMTCERESVPSDAAPNATYWLDLCSPRYVANMLRGPSIAYNFVLSVDTSPRGAAAGGAAGLRVIETRYDQSDVFCARGPLSQKAIFFPNGPASGSPACVKDPLSHGRYYQVSPGVNPQVIAAVQSSAPTPSPTRPYTGPVPTAPPTLNPATARPTSTLQPTSSIWTKSFASNFTSTGCTSSQYVTGLPFCTGSLGSFWTVGWQNVGSNPVPAPSLPYPIYATTRTGSA